MKYKKYAVYYGDLYVETYKDLKEAQAHIQWQEKDMGTTGWRIIESEYPYTMTQERVANLISLVATTVDRVHRGNFDAVTDMMEYIKGDPSRYGDPCEDLMNHLFDTLNTIRCDVEWNVHHSVFQSSFLYFFSRKNANKEHLTILCLLYLLLKSVNNK